MIHSIDNAFGFSFGIIHITTDYRRVSKPRELIKQPEACHGQHEKAPRELLNTHPSGAYRRAGCRVCYGLWKSVFWGQMYSIWEHSTHGLESELSITPYNPQLVFQPAGAHTYSKPSSQ